MNWDSLVSLSLLWNFPLYLASLFLRGFFISVGIRIQVDYRLEKRFSFPVFLLKLHFLVDCWLLRLSCDHFLFLFLLISWIFLFLFLFGFRSISFELRWRRLNCLQVQLFHRGFPSWDSSSCLREKSRGVVLLFILPYRQVMTWWILKDSGTCHKFLRLRIYAFFIHTFNFLWFFLLGIFFFCFFFHFLFSFFFFLFGFQFFLIERHPQEVEHLKSYGSLAWG